ncbi:MAG: GIY-YIG nuclease family protein [bacterium]
MGSNPTLSVRHITMPYHTYILKSLTTGKFYKGSCENIQRRLLNHNTSKVRSSKAGCPWTLHYSETFLTRSEAMKRELFFKSRPGWRWLKQAGIT